MDTKINDQCWRLTTRPTVEPIEAERSHVRLNAHRGGWIDDLKFFLTSTWLTLKSQKKEKLDDAPSLKSRIFYFIT